MHACRMANRCSVAATHALHLQWDILTFEDHPPTTASAAWTPVATGGGRTGTGTHMPCMLL